MHCCIACGVDVLDDLGVLNEAVFRNGPGENAVIVTVSVLVLAVYLPPVCFVLQSMI